MHFFEKQKLLNDTFRDGDYERFRAETFRAGLRVLRSRRGPRARLERWALAASVAFALGLALLSMRPSRERIVTAEPVGRLSFRSVPLAAEQIVRSAKDESLFVETHGAGVEVVETEPVPVMQINNRELLAIFGNRPAGLMGDGQKVELVVLGN